MKLHLTADLEANYRRFLKNVADNEEIFMAVTAHNNTPLMYQSNYSETMVTLCWSDLPYAKRFVDQNADTLSDDVEIITLPLASFPHNLYLSAQHNVLMGPNWTSDAAGLEVDPRQLQEDLIKEYFYVDRPNKDSNTVNELLIHGLCFNLAFHLFETEMTLQHLQDPTGEFKQMLADKIALGKHLIDCSALDIDVIYPPENRPA